MVYLGYLNQNIVEIRKKLKNEIQLVLESMQNGSFDEEITNTIIKMQNKINILVSLELSRRLTLMLTVSH